MLTQTTSRVLEPSDLDAALAVLDREPVANAFVTVAGPGRRPRPVAARRRDVGLVRGRHADAPCATRAPTWSRSAPPREPSAPSPTAPAGPAAAAPPSSAPPTPPPCCGGCSNPAGARPGRSASHQPLMVTDRMPADIAPDPYVRRIRKDEMETIMPACVAMFTEEVGVSPLAGDGGLLYQARVAELVGSGRSFARLDEHGKVVFKAEIGAATDRACQIQGVWVAPEYRGTGPRRPGHGGRAALRAGGRGPDRQPLRQRLQHAGAKGVPAGGLPRGRRVHERPVLEHASRCCSDARTIPVRSPHASSRSRSPPPPRRHRDRPPGPLGPRRRGPGRPGRRLRSRRGRGGRTPPDRPAPHDLPRRQGARRDRRRTPRRLRLRHAQRPHPLVVHRRGALPPGPGTRRLARRLLRHHRAARPPAPPEPRHRPHPDHHHHRRRRRAPLDPLRDRHRQPGPRPLPLPRLRGPRPPGPLPERPEAVRRDGRPAARCAAADLNRFPPAPAPPG